MAFVTLRLIDSNNRVALVSVDYWRNEWYSSSPCFGFHTAGWFTVTPDKIGRFWEVEGGYWFYVASLSRMPLHASEIQASSGGMAFIYRAPVAMRYPVNWRKHG